MTGYAPLDAAMVLASLMVARMILPVLARRLSSGQWCVLAGCVAAPLTGYASAALGWTV